ncbi:hypothetical protein NVP1170O_110 [Vibrio phage 1.170.O._10N.261.52.C3]|nr:hypothetical protein NVP1170O_110 [Vibrio phage 1.170.O._10N.261.52.C3]
MKNFTLTALLLASFTASATTTELYQINTLESGSSISQDTRPTIRIAPSSGLPKMHCTFYNSKEEKIAVQNVTVFEEYDLFVLVEANFYHDQHVAIDYVVCR